MGSGWNERISILKSRHVQGFKVVACVYISTLGTYKMPKYCCFYSLKSSRSLLPPPEAKPESINIKGTEKVPSSYCQKEYRNVLQDKFTSNKATSWKNIDPRPFSFYDPLVLFCTL